MPTLYHHKLQYMLGDLTPTERKIAEYIEEHQGGIRGMSSVSLAEAAGVSQPAVIRFSKKLGYGGYKQMINDVGTEQADEFINMDVEEAEDTATTMALLTKQYSTIVSMTFSLNDAKLVDQAVQYIYQARKIVVAGYSERNHYLSNYLCYRFMNIGLEAYTNAHASMLYAQLLNCDAGDVLILLSESGETRDLLNYAKVAKRKGMLVISITRFASNTLQTLSDVNFKVVEYGGRTFLRSCMVRLSMNYIIDTLFLNLTKMDYSEYRSRAARLSQMTKLSYEAPDPLRRKTT